MSAEKSIGAIAAAGLAIVCCAGPLLLATIGSVAISASVLTGWFAIVAGVVGIGLVGVWAHHRRRSAGPNIECCAPETAKRKSDT